MNFIHARGIVISVQFFMHEVVRCGEGTYQILPSTIPTVRQNLYNDIQSTIAEELAHILNVPCVHLDAVFWKPNWGQPDDDEFQQRVLEILDSTNFARGWVMDGDYSSRLEDVVNSRVTDVICSSFVALLVSR